MNFRPVTAAGASLLVLSSFLLPALAESEAAKPIKIGMILEARPEVEPWSAAWHDAAEKLKAADPSIEVMQSFDAFDSSRAEPVARQMLDAGADVLALTTFVLSDVSRAVSADYPEVPMTVSSFGVVADPNLSSVTASYLEIGYSTCWLLTRLSDDGRIGIVGAQEAPFETESLEGCEIGAKAANAGAALTVVNTNSFSDTQANREQVQALLDQGITEIFLLSGTEDALGGFRLCEAVGAHCATWGGDSRRWAPKSAVLTVVLDWSVVLADQIAQARSGNVESKVYNLTFGDGGLTVTDFSHTDAVSPELEAEFRQVIAGLASLEIALPESKAHPGLR